MPAIRRYGCDKCQGEFEVFHASIDEPPPDACPLCEVSGARIKWRPAWSGAIKGNASRAGDLAAEVAMENHGLTDLRDARHEGDVSAPRLQLQTAEGRKMLEMMDSKGGIFSAGAVPPGHAPQAPAGSPMLSTQEILSAARAIPRSEKVTNFERFHAGLKARPVRDNSEARLAAMKIPDAQNKGIG